MEASAGQVRHGRSRTGRLLATLSGHLIVGGAYLSLRLKLLVHGIAMLVGCSESYGRHYQTRTPLLGDSGLPSALQS